MQFPIRIVRYITDKVRLFEELAKFGTKLYLWNL